MTMQWTKSDWLDLGLMILGACLGSALLELCVLPASGHTLPGGDFASLLWSGLAGIIGAYLLRYVVWAWRTRG